MLPVAVIVTVAEEAPVKSMAVASNWITGRPDGEGGGCCVPWPCEGGAGL